MSLADVHPVEALTHRAIAAFTEQFDRTPTVAAMAPGRVNLIGEHTDYNDGLVLPTAIDRYTLIVADVNRSKRCRIWAAEMGDPLPGSDTPPGELAVFINGESLSAGRTRWPNYVKGVLAMFVANGHTIPSFDAAVVSSVPVGAGLSSSAALEVATATLAEALLGIRVDPVRKAAWCRTAERNFVGVPCGLMDQLAASAGRNGAALLIDCRDRSIKPIPIDDPDLAVLVTDSMVRHQLADGRYAERRAACELAVQVLRSKGLDHILTLRDANLNDLELHREALGDILFHRARHVVLENQRVPMVADALLDRRYDTAGFLMNEGHRSLHRDFQVSCEELDLLASLAQSFPGVYGSRMTGGGFGGCTVTLCRAHAAQPLTDHLTANYLEKTGRTPRCFLVHPSGPARSWSLVAPE